MRKVTPFSVIASCAIGFMLALVLYLTFLYKPVLPVKNYVVEIPQPSAHFLTFEGQLGLTGKGKTIYRIAQPSCKDDYADDREGEYYAGKITVRCNQDALRTTAHEYLHAVWEQVDPQTKSEITRELNEFARQYPQTEPRFKWYRDKKLTNEQMINEVHAAFGTEINRNQLSPRLQSWYAQWLPNPLPAKCC